jgi:hypothetical protein
MGTKVEAELRESLCRIGEIIFKQTDPDATQIAHGKGDRVIIFPDEDVRIKVKDAIRGKKFSIRVNVVSTAKIGQRIKEKYKKLFSLSET